MRTAVVAAFAGLAALAAAAAFVYPSAERVDCQAFDDPLHELRAGPAPAACASRAPQAGSSAASTNEL